MKQDRTYTRTASALEQKYNFGKSFAEVYGLIDGVQKNAEQAVKDLDASLNPDEIFNRLTNYGKVQGIYRSDDGDVYVNASYIKSGKLAAEYIDADNLEVKAANITGTLTANQINMTGAITWSDLAGGVQNVINAAYNSGGFSKMEIQTFITDELVASPTIVGGTFYAVGRGSHLEMTSIGLDTYVGESPRPTMSLEGDPSDNTVQLILGAGTSSTNDSFGRMFVWKGLSGGGVHYIGGSYDEPSYLGKRVGFEFGDDGVISFYGTLALDGLLSMEYGGVNYGYFGISEVSTMGGYGATMLDPTEENGFWAFTTGVKMQAGSLDNQVVIVAPSASTDGGVSVVSRGRYFYFDDSKFYTPVTNGGATLGFSNAPWGQIYSTSSTISTSDREKKNSIVYDMDERYDTLWSLLKPCTGKFNDGTSDRTHMFLISQDVEDAIEEAGLTTQDFAAFIKSPKMDENFNVIEGYDYALRYEEFIPLCIRQIQKLQTRVAELEERTA